MHARSRGGVFLCCAARLFEGMRARSGGGVFLCCAALRCAARLFEGMRARRSITVRSAVRATWAARAARAAREEQVHNGPRGHLKGCSCTWRGVLVPHGHQPEPPLLGFCLPCAGAIEPPLLRTFGSPRQSSSLYRVYCSLAYRRYCFVRRSRRFSGDDIWGSGTCEAELNKRCDAMDSLRGSSVNIGLVQRILSWLLRKDDTYKSRSVYHLVCYAQKV